MISDTELDLAIKRERKLKKLNEQRYHKALKLEKVREWHQRKTRQGAFEASFVSLDAIAETHGGTDKLVVLSDHGRGVESMVGELDGDEDALLSIRARRLEEARKRIMSEHPEWLEVFELIIKNGTNRKESIWQMTSKKLQNGTPQGTDIGGT